MASLQLPSTMAFPRMQLGTNSTQAQQPRRAVEGDAFEAETGFSKLQKELDRIDRKLNTLRSHGARRTSSLSPPHASSRDALRRIEDKKDLQKKALELLEKKEKKYREELLHRYQPLLEKEIAQIKKIPNDIGTPRTKTNLIKMRQNMLSRRIDLEVEKKKLNDWTLHNLMLEVKQDRKRIDTDSTRQEIFRNHPESRPRSIVQGDMDTPMGAGSTVSTGVASAAVEARRQAAMNPNLRMLK
eukprot:GILK01001584.1.p1 GENE.GILK01001584.1~~GILK01001584.1.p1  ORF type:complete len:280 (+),score=64.10 GILK01001584.1:116-841(+)